MFWLVLALFGVLAGVTTVLLGFGGGFVAVPLLFTLIRLDYPPGSATAAAAMHIAVATSSAAMVFSAGMASWRHYRAGTLQWSAVRPLMAFVAVGALAGACVASRVSGSWLRWLFVAYLGVTMLDAWLRTGVAVKPAGAIEPLSRRASVFIGVAMGAIAAFLGVGGSVMSVPLMRRRGASMAVATASANPLSLPIAVAGTIAYAFLASRSQALGAGLLGYVDLRSLAVLVLASWCGIRVGARFIGQIPESAHVKSYWLLLGIVLVVMVANG